jgi:hypothetical protein
MARDGGYLTGIDDRPGYRRQRRADGLPASSGCVALASFVWMQRDEAALALKRSAVQVHEWTEFDTSTAVEDYFATELMETDTSEAVRCAWLDAGQLGPRVLGFQPLKAARRSKRRPPAKPKAPKANSSEEQGGDPDLPTDPSAR